MTKLGIKDILETIEMVDNQHLDVRTITMGISLLDCVDSDINKVCTKVYDKITQKAEHLVKTGKEIEMELGIPIVNERISVTPVSIIANPFSSEEAVKIAQALDKAALETGVNFLGGFSSLVHKGYTKGDRAVIAAIPEALATTDKVCSSVNIGSTKAGLNMYAIAQMGKVIKEIAEKTKDNNCFGCSKLVVFCNAPEDNPFMAGAFHGVGESECAINVGVSGPGVVKYALEKVRGADFGVVAETIKKTAFKITRVGQLVAQEASQRLGVPVSYTHLDVYKRQNQRLFVIFIASCQNGCFLLPLAKNQTFWFFYFIG